MDTSVGKSITSAAAAIKTAVADGDILLVPSPNLDNVPKMHVVTVESVVLSSNDEDGDVYLQRGGDDESKRKYALTKQGLLKLAAIAGVQWDWNFSGRTDSGTSRDYISYRAVGAVQKLDGSWLALKGEYDLDFEVVDADLKELYYQKCKNWNKPQAVKDSYIESSARRDLLKFRRYKTGRAETGAMLRAIRGLLNIKGGYRADELKKRFVGVRLVFQPDYSDALVKAQVIALALQNSQGIYGGGVPRLPAPSAQGIPFSGPQSIDELRNVHPLDADDLPDPDPVPEPEDDMVGETSGETDFLKKGVSDQIKDLEKLMKTKGYAEMTLKTPLSEFSAENRLGFFRHLSAMPDDDIPF